MMLANENPDNPKAGQETNAPRSYEQVNETKSIWTKNKSEVTDEQYNDFYKSLAYDFNAPLANIHLNIE